MDGERTLKTNDICKVTILCEHGVSGSTGWVNFAGCLGKDYSISVHCFLAQLWNTANSIAANDQMISRVHRQGFSAEECPNQGSASEPLCLAWFVRCPWSCCLLHDGTLHIHAASYSLPDPWHLCPLPCLPSRVPALPPLLGGHLKVIFLS